jgi:hypothetical protein
VCLQYGYIYIYIYIGQSNFVGALNCVPHLTTYGEIWSELLAFICRQQVEMSGQTHAPVSLLPETVAQATPENDVLRPQRPYWQFIKHKILLPEFEIWLDVRTARGLATTPTISCLLLCLRMNWLSHSLFLALTKINVCCMILIVIDSNMNARLQIVEWAEKG